MREIKFRGKRIDNGEWVYGFYYTTQEFITPRLERTAAWIVWTEFTDNGKSFNHKVEVDPATVGQYTGLQDRNGKEIYEGDVCAFHHEEPIRTLYGSVYLNDDSGYSIGGKQQNVHMRLSADRAGRISVSGNIHDTPKLIEQSDE